MTIDTDIKYSHAPHQQSTPALHTHATQPLIAEEERLKNANTNLWTRHICISTHARALKKCALHYGLYILLHLRPSCCVRSNFISFCELFLQFLLDLRGGMLESSEHNCFRKYMHPCIKIHFDKHSCRQTDKHVYCHRSMFIVIVVPAHF